MQYATHGLPRLLHGPNGGREADASEELAPAWNRLRHPLKGMDQPRLRLEGSFGGALFQDEEPAKLGAVFAPHLVGEGHEAGAGACARPDLDDAGGEFSGVDAGCVFDVGKTARAGRVAMLAHSVHLRYSGSSGVVGGERGVDALERGEAGVGNLSTNELGYPRMAHFGRLTHAGPLTALGLQEGLDFGVQVGAHASIIVKDSLSHKEHFPSPSAHPHWMQGKDINLVVAENLRHWMRKAGVTQAHLAALAGVNQKTISNYLNPYQRTEGSSGKQGSPKLYELDLIARSLGIEVWQLTREMSAAQREVYDAIEKAFALASRSAASASPLTPLTQDDLAPQERETPEDKRMAREVLDRSIPSRPRKRST